MHDQFWPIGSDQTHLGFDPDLIKQRPVFGFGKSNFMKLSTAINWSRSLCHTSTANIALHWVDLFTVTHTHICKIVYV